MAAPAQQATPAQFVAMGLQVLATQPFSVLASGTAMAVPVVTAEFKINYLRPAIGERLIARARAVHVGRTQAVCTCEVFAVNGGEEKLCALAQGTIARLSPASDAEAAPSSNP